MRRRAAGHLTRDVIGTFSNHHSWISNNDLADKQGGLEVTPICYIPHIPSQVTYSSSNEDYGFVTIKHAGWDTREGGKLQTDKDGVSTDHRELLQVKVAATELMSLKGQLEMTKVQTAASW